jgi:phosphatidylinositol glycan class T
MKRRLFLFASFYSLISRINAHEQFEEELTIRPLRDGKVSTTFAFTTLLKGASPRDPRTLGLDDECNVTALRKI